MGSGGGGAVCTPPARQPLRAEPRLREAQRPDRDHTQMARTPLTGHCFPSRPAAHREEPCRAQRAQRAGRKPRAQVGGWRGGAHPVRPRPPRQAPHSPDGLDDFVSSIVVFVLKDKGTVFTPSGDARGRDRGGLPDGPGLGPEVLLRDPCPGWTCRPWEDLLLQHRPPHQPDPPLPPRPHPSADSSPHPPGAAVAREPQAWF